MKQHEIKFVVRLQNDAKKSTMSLGIDPKQLASALNTVNKVAGVRRTSAREQIAAQAAELRNSQLAARLERTRLTTEAQRYRTNMSGIRQTQTAAIAQQRIRAEAARTETELAVQSERRARGQLQTEREVLRGSMQRASAQSQVNLQQARADRAALINRREHVRLLDSGLQAQQRSAAASQRLNNSQIQGQRAQINLERSQLALQQQRLRLSRSALGLGGSRGGGGGGGRVAGASLSLLGGNVGSAVASALGASQIAKIADEYSNLNARVSLVTKSEREHQLVMQGLTTTANETRVGLKGTADVYYSLARNNQALGLSQNELLGFTKAINQSITISGTTAQSANYALIQLGQAFGTGQLRGEELNSVLEQMPRLATAIAEGLGVGVPGALKTMAMKGELTIPKLLEALKSQMAKLDAEFARMPKTIGQGLTTLRNGLMVFIGSVDKASGASHGLGQLLYEIGQTLSSPTFISGAADFGNKVADVLRDVGSVVGTTFTFIKNHMDELKIAFEVITSVIAGVFIANGINKAMLAVYAFRTSLVALMASMALTGGTISGLTTVIGGLSIASLGIVGVVGAAAAGLAWLAWNSRDSAVAARAAKEAHDNLPQAMLGVQDYAHKAALATGELKEEYIKQGDAAIAAGKSALAGAQDQLNAAKAAVAAFDAIQTAKIAGGVDANGIPLAAVAVTTQLSALERKVVEKSAALGAIEKELGIVRGQAIMGTRERAAILEAKDRADAALMNAKGPKLNMPGKDKKDKATPADPWDAILRKINRAKYNIEEAKDAMTLLNARVSEGSADWDAYKAAIDRVYGFAESPLGQATRDLEEQLPLLAIRNDAERARAEIIAKTLLDQKDFDPTGQYKAEADAAAIQLKKNLGIKDEAELRNSIANSVGDALADAQIQLSVSGMSSEQAAVELELQKYITEYKKLGLGLSEDEIRLKLEGISAQVAETERLKRLEDRDPVMGAKKALKQYFEDSKNLGVQTAEAVGNAFSNAENMLVDFAMTGKMAFGDFAKSVIADVLRMIAKLLIMKAITTAISFIPGGSAVLNLIGLGSTAANVAGSVKAATTVRTDHLGGIVGRGASGSASVAMSAFAGARKFHTGGTVPGLKSGEVPIVAKKGEAVLPTVRLPNGQMGVQMAGGNGGGGDFSPTIPVTVNIYGNQGQGENSAMAGKNMGNEIGKAVESAMNDWAYRNKKPGGALYSMGRV